MQQINRNVKVPVRSQVTREDRLLHMAFTETENGKKTLEYLKSIFYNNSTFVQGDENTNLIMYKIGQQDVIGFILETINLVESEPSIIQEIK